MDRGWKPNVDMSPNCPRCGSSNTKFCYYNNYSLTQPRYFCKGCRRYWTKGGSLRNVPIGGGCRKSRRGKSLRLSSSPTDVKSLGYGGVTTTDHPNRHFHGYKGIDSSVESCSSSDGSHIDLALVYANFLNPQQPDSNTTTTTSSGFEMRELSTDRFHDHSLDLTSMSDTNLDNNNYLARCINVISDSSIEAPLNDHDHQLMYYCGMDSSSTHKQQAVNDRNIQQCTSDNDNNDHNNETMISYGLPPLPGEEIACGEILWPNSDHIMDHNHTFQQQTVVAPKTDQDPNSLLFGNWSPFDLSRDDTFSRS